MEAAVPEWVARHAARRQHGVPTVSLLEGTPEVAWNVWRDAFPRSARADAASDLLGAWLAACQAKAPLGALLTRSLDARLGPTSSSQGSLHDRLMALEARLKGHISATAEAVLRAAWASPAPLDTAELAAAVAPASVFTGLTGLLELAPALGEQAIFFTGRLGPAAAEALARLAEAAPDLPIGAALDAQEALRIEVEVPRVWAALREGWVRATLAPAAASSAQAWLLRRGARSDAFAALERAARALERAEPLVRSEAERLLFLALELCPETRGVFRLNATLPARFGTRNVEVDLWAEGLALALEVDGYFHFRSDEDFRRDRRKDLLLQELGQRVVRVLATDVVTRLEETVGLICGAVARRKEGRA